MSLTSRPHPKHPPSRLSSSWSVRIFRTPYAPLLDTYFRESRSEIDTGRNADCDGAECHWVTLEVRGLGEEVFDISELAWVDVVASCGVVVRCLPARLKRILTKRAAPTDDR
jgi:hypothetical protein